MTLFETDIIYCTTHMTVSKMIVLFTIEVKINRLIVINL